MITDLIINVLMSIPYLLLQGMENLNFDLSIPANFYSTLESLCSGVGFVLPISGLLPISFITAGLYSFRIVWAFIIRIKSFIPTMGS